MTATHLHGNVQMKRTTVNTNNTPYYYNDMVSILKQQLDIQNAVLHSTNDALQYFMTYINTQPSNYAVTQQTYQQYPQQYNHYSTTRVLPPHREPPLPPWVVRTRTCTYYVQIHLFTKT